MSDPETQLESVEYLRRLIEKDRASSPPGRANIETQDVAIPMRPLSRPPMAMLCLLDDDGELGEWHRLRGDRYVIGRTMGDVTIQHDGAISNPHAELVRARIADAYKWVIRDLGSTNGTFARISQAELRHEQEFIVGSQRVRLEASQDHCSPSSNDQTQRWSIANLKEIKQQSAALLLLDQNEDKRILLSHTQENCIGSDPSCSIRITDDPYLSRIHASISRSKDGTWRLLAKSTRNGVWAQIREMMIESSGEFLIGEQRFLIRTSSKNPSA